MYKIGEIGDPCGTPAFVQILSDSTPLNFSLALLFCKKFSTHLTHTKQSLPGPNLQSRLRRVGPEPVTVHALRREPALSLSLSLPCKAVVSPVLIGTRFAKSLPALSWLPWGNKGGESHVAQPLSDCKLNNFLEAFVSQNLLLDERKLVFRSARHDFPVPVPIGEAVLARF
jgi:hypothetical protein